MSIQVTIVLVGLMICLTIITRWVLDYIVDQKRIKSDKSVEYWKGRYYALANILDKGANYQFSDELLEKIDEIKLKNM